MPNIIYAIFVFNLIYYYSNTMWYFQKYKNNIISLGRVQITLLQSTTKNNIWIFFFFFLESLTEKQQPCFLVSWVESIFVYKCKKLKEKMHVNINNLVMIVIKNASNKKMYLGTVTQYWYFATCHLCDSVEENKKARLWLRPVWCAVTFPAPSPPLQVPWVWPSPTHSSTGTWMRLSPLSVCPPPSYAVRFTSELRCRPSTPSRTGLTSNEPASRTLWCSMRTSWPSSPPGQGLSSWLHSNVSGWGCAFHVKLSPP